MLFQAGLCAVSDADEEMKDKKCLRSTPLPIDYTNMLQQKMAHLDQARAKQVQELIDELKKLF